MTRQPLMDLSRRFEVATMVGADAETLVYRYASCDRAWVYPRLSAAAQVEFRDRFTGPCPVRPHASAPERRGVAGLRRDSAALTDETDEDACPRPPRRPGSIGGVDGAH